MELGAFSISLNVKDLEASKVFYEKLGFRPIAGAVKDNWLVLKNAEHLIGLFQGMFEKHMLTFNPGWDQNGNNTDSFTDIRELQMRLRESGIKLISEVDERTTGPGSCMTEDPDGNPILIDQHR
jgi:catechol 2,3-dioxygenase-like lactoylglutathione lyase family enzyme